MRPIDRFISLKLFSFHFSPTAGEEFASSAEGGSCFYYTDCELGSLNTIVEVIIKIESRSIQNKKILVIDNGFHSVRLGTVSRRATIAG